MKYNSVALQEEFSIRKIISIHYFEYMNNFAFAGESHNFWEFLCVDKGEVDIVSDLEHLTLHAGDIIFHKPNEFHSVSANGVIAPNLVVISFECQDPAMNFFKDRILTIGEAERRLLAQIITEARSCFEGPLDNPYQEQLILKESPRFGSQQMIKIYLEQLLIHLFRNFSYVEHLKPPANLMPEKSEALYNSITDYMERNLCAHLTVEQICRDNLISSSQLKKLFREREHCGVMEYFNHMKIKYAKELIRGRKMNFSQIADHLGYSSVHYFSRQFKHVTGMTPTEYTDSIKQLAEPPYLRKG